MSLLTRHILSRQGLRPGEWRYGEFGPGGGSVCDSSDIALSSLVISDSSSSARAGCYGTDLAEASSVHLSPIATSMRKLCRVSPLHPEGPRGGYSGLPRSSWWPFSRQNPLVTRFFRPEKLMLSGGSGCDPITLSPLISPRLWELRLTHLKV